MVSEGRYNGVGLRVHGFATVSWLQAVKLLGGSNISEQVNGIISDHSQLPRFGISCAIRQYFSARWPIGYRL